MAIHAITSLRADVITVASTKAAIPEASGESMAVAEVKPASAPQPAAPRYQTTKTNSTRGEQAPADGQSKTFSSESK